MLKILCAHAGVVIDRFLNSFELETEEEMQAQLLKFCNKICGERAQQHLTAAIENYLPGCLNFEHACALFCEQGKLFAIRCAKDDEEQLLAEGFTELPRTLGLTGKCLQERTSVVSADGKYDTLFNAQVDNVLKLKKLENIMIIPLFVDHRNGKVLYNDKSETQELVGILHLINYKMGDVTKCDEVPQT